MKGIVTTGTELDNMKIRDLWQLVRVCRVKEAKRKCYVTMHFTAAAQELAKFVDAALIKAGATRQEDAPPPTPAVQDLKKALATMGYWGPTPNMDF